MPRRHTPPRFLPPQLLPTHYAPNPGPATGHIRFVHTLWPAVVVALVAVAVVYVGGVEPAVRIGGRLAGRLGGETSVDEALDVGALRLRDEVALAEGQVKCGGAVRDNR